MFELWTKSVLNKHHIIKLQEIVSSPVCTLAGHCCLLSFILLCHKFCCKIIFSFLHKFYSSEISSQNSALTGYYLKYLSKIHWILLQSYNWLQFSFHRHIYKMLVSSQLSHLCLWTRELFPFLHFLQNHFHEWHS